MPTAPARCDVCIAKVSHKCDVTLINTIVTLATSRKTSPGTVPAPYGGSGMLKTIGGGTSVTNTPITFCHLRATDPGTHLLLTSLPRSTKFHSQIVGAPHTEARQIATLNRHQLHPSTCCCFSACCCCCCHCCCCCAADCPGCQQQPSLCMNTLLLLLLLLLCCCQQWSASHM
jgi:hypothetical protein